REVDPEQQAEMQARALEFTQCMRDHGVDMADPQFDADGRMSISVGGPGSVRVDPDVMEAAQEASNGFIGPAPDGSDGGDAETGTVGDTAPAPSAALP